MLFFISTCLDFIASTERKIDLLCNMARHIRWRLCCGSRGKKPQTFFLRFCILQVIISLRRRRPGNEANCKVYHSIEVGIPPVWKYVRLSLKYMYVVVPRQFSIYTKNLLTNIWGPVATAMCCCFSSLHLLKIHCALMSIVVGDVLHGTSIAVPLSWYRVDATNLVIVLYLPCRCWP